VIADQHSKALRDQLILLLTSYSGIGFDILDLKLRFCNIPEPLNVPQCTSLVCGKAKGAALFQSSNPVFRFTKA